LGAQELLDKPENLKMIQNQITHQFLPTRRDQGCDSTRRFQQRR
jgi:hypothetical protein